MSEMSQSDVELCYKYLDDRTRSDIEAEAYSRAYEMLDDDSREKLEAAHDDPDSDFAWENIQLVFRKRGRDKEVLAPLDGVEWTEEQEIDELATDHGWEIVEQVRDEVRSLQESTMLSPREFVTLVVDSEWGEENAATTMNISVGNYRGKKGNINNKVEKAQKTLDIVGRIRDE